MHGSLPIVHGHKTEPRGQRWEEGSMENGCGGQLWQPERPGGQAAFPLTSTQDQLQIMGTEHQPQWGPQCLTPGWRDSEV